MQVLSLSRLYYGFVKQKYIAYLSLCIAAVLYECILYMFSFKIIRSANRVATVTKRKLPITIILLSRLYMNEFIETNSMERKKKPSRRNKKQISYRTIYRNIPISIDNVRSYIYIAISRFTIVYYTQFRTFLFSFSLYKSYHCVWVFFRLTWCGCCNSHPFYDMGADDADEREW